MKDLPPKPTYRSVKTSLKSVVKNNLVTEKLIDTAFRTNNIMIHALQLLQLYLLHCCDVDDELPKLDRRFVTSVMKVLCKAPSSGRPPSAETQIIMDTFKDFYEQHYKACMSEELSYEHMSATIDYLSIDVITMYESNIKQSYVEYVERYVNVSWRKKELVAMTKESWRNTRSRQNVLCARLRRVKDDLLRPHQPKMSDPSTTRG